MVRSAAQSVEEYLAGLPEERRAVIAELRKLIRKHLPKGYQESVSFGMLSYCVPLARYPDTYNGQPLGYVALASQKNYFALYLMGAYMDPVQAAALKDAFEKAGKKFDMGKSCLRFRKLDDLPLDAVSSFIASTPVETFIGMYESSRPARKTK
jgi:uncharacterized protein YdhG (YjbR/CyaY superfamily)